MGAREQLVDTFVHMPPGRVLSGVTAAEADRRIGAETHTIAEIVAHMIFWQEWFAGRCEGRAAPMAASAAIGWPAVAPGSFDALRDRFLTGAGALASLQTRSADVLAPPIEFPPLAHYTVADVLVHVAQHNSHHLGQIVTLRQIMTVWPPAEGSWTW